MTPIFFSGAYFLDGFRFVSLKTTQKKLFRWKNSFFTLFFFINTFFSAQKCPDNIRHTVDEAVIGGTQSTIKGYKNDIIPVKT
jgi:hypothetical protein